MEQNILEGEHLARRKKAKKNPSPEEGPPVEENAENEQKPVPDDIMDALSALLDGDGPDQDNQPETDTMPTEPTEPEKPTYEHKGPGTPAGELLPPREFFEWVMQRKSSYFTKRQKEALFYLYDHPEQTIHASALKAGFSYRSALRAVEKLRTLYERYKSQFQQDEVIPEPAPLPVEPVPAVEAPTKRQKASAPKEEKISNEVLKMSKATTTFKEIDKTIAELLGAEFHDSAVKKNIYAKLGELLIYTLLQLGAIDRDKIVEYSQTLVENPDALYFYVKEQLDAVIKITDPDTLQKIWMENAQLRARVMALEATADMLSDALNYYAETIRVLISLLDKKQLEKFATWIYMSEYMRRLKKKKKKVGGV